MLVPTSAHPRLPDLHPFRVRVTDVARDSLFPNLLYTINHWSAHPGSETHEVRCFML